jgi:hypothetical protein
MKKPGNSAFQKLPWNDIIVAEYARADEKKVVGSCGDIPQDTKQELVQNVLKLEQCLFGATPNERRTLAFSVAERTHISHRFSNNKKMAHKTFLYEFVSRYTNLTLTEPEAVILARDPGFNKERFIELCDVLVKILYCSILLHSSLNYDQFIVLCANTCQFYKFTFKIF